MVLSRMQLALYATRRTPHAASRLVQAISVWSVKTRPAPYQRFIDARINGLETTAMYQMSELPPSPNPSAPPHQPPPLPITAPTYPNLTQVIQNLGAADIDTRLEEQLIDGILFAFQEQVREACGRRGLRLGRARGRGGVTWCYNVFPEWYHLSLLYRLML